MTNEKEVKLKPCPFCGGEASFIGDTRCIMCKNCGCRLLINNPLLSTQDVAKVWNKRANAVDAYVEKMDLEQIDQLCDSIAQDNGAESVKIISWRELEE